MKQVCWCSVRTVTFIMQFNSVKFNSVQFFIQSNQLYMWLWSERQHYGQLLGQKSILVITFTVRTMNEIWWSHLEKGQTYNTCQVLATYLVCILLCILSRLSVDCDKGQQHIVFDQDRSNPCKDHGTDISHTHPNPQTVPRHKDTVAECIPKRQLGISLNQSLHQSH